MIQVNLLPDVKQELLKTHRIRNFVVSIAILMAIAAVGSVALVGGLFFAVKGAEVLADNEIKSEYAKLSEVRDLSKALTIKNQLEEISSAHNNKNITSRVFNLLSVVTSGVGDNIKFSSINVDTTSKNIAIEAQATDFGTIESFRKTIDKTVLEYKTSANGNKNTEPVASDIKVSESSMTDNQEGGKVVRFKIEFTYNEAMLLYSSYDAFFKAPKKTIATDSKLNIPNSLFTSDTKNEDLKEENNGN